MFERMGASRESLQTRVVRETMRVLSGNFDPDFEQLRACLRPSRARGPQHRDRLDVEPEADLEPRPVGKVADVRSLGIAFAA
jgi:hypothetical protein